MIDIAKICRLCISDTSSMINVLSVDEDSVTLSDKLKTVCDIQINVNDCLPTALCVMCQEKLRQFYEFKLMCLHSNVLLNRYKKDLTSSNTILNELRKKITPVFANVEVKQENDRTNDGTENISQLTKTNSFTDSINNASQNVIPLRKSRGDDRFSDDNRSYDEFADTSLELNVEEVEEVLINWGNNKQESSTTGDKSTGSSKEDFKWEKSLKSHRKLHTRTVEEMMERKFSCEQCGKMFKTKDSLMKHAAVHSDERPYKCDLCGKTFKFQSCWRTHKKHHEGKKVVCNICVEYTI
ncbi:senseless-2 [Carabus blaptoides fortunei]